MTIARMNSFAFAGIDTQPVEVVQISSGLPNFLMLNLIPTSAPQLSLWFCLM
jgi:hypothetical protein